MRAYSATPTPRPISRRSQQPIDQGGAFAGLSAQAGRSLMRRWARGSDEFAPQGRSDRRRSTRPSPGGSSGRSDRTACCANRSRAERQAGGSRALRTKFMPLAKRQPSSCGVLLARRRSGRSRATCAVVGGKGTPVEHFCPVRRHARLLAPSRFMTTDRRSSPVADRMDTAAALHPERYVA